MTRRLVIPDIHGCLKTFKALLDKVALSKEDTLFLLGDYVDRGPDNCGVLDYIKQLQKEGYGMRPLRGNHEHNWIQASHEYDWATFKFYAKRMKGIDLLTEGKIKDPYYEFMKSLPFYFQLDDFYLVHGGIDFRKEKPFEDKERLLVLRKNYYDAEKAGNRRVIFGHQPTHIEDILEAIEQKAPLIPLDNGCIYTKAHKIYDYTRLGRLLCFNLDSWELTMMKNIDV